MDGTANNWMGLMLVLIPALPLAAALAGYLLTAAAHRGARVNAWLGGLSLLASAGLGGVQLVLIQQSRAAEAGPTEAAWSVPWFTMPGGLEVPLALFANEMQLVFILTTALVGLAVVIFAARERRDDPRRGVFHATLTLFAGSMLLFLAADTLVLVYIAWELMGLCSYLLIAHPGTKEAWRAARQAFWTTRATDFGLLFAVLILLAKFQWPTLNSIDINLLVQQLQNSGISTVPYFTWLTVAALLILLGVVGKSAQLPLCFWLPDAMVAPAPVSALLHAATMVAAGPYLLIKMFRLFRLMDTSMLAATLVGGLTLVAGAVMALCARDPKRVLAYSTISHLGLVVLSVGVMAEEAGYYHLVAHAWFKAALFLGVGYLVYVWSAGQSGEHRAPALDELAGSARRHPLLLWGVLVPAGLSLAGLFPLAGALGKEQILYALLTRGSQEIGGQIILGDRFPVAAAGWLVGAILMLIALPLTGAYIARLVGILGWGRSSAPAGSGAIPASDPDPVQSRALAGWSPALLSTAALALVGSVVWAAVYYLWFATPAGFVSVSTPWKLGGRGDLVMLASTGIGLIAVLTGVALAWYLRVADPELGNRIFRDGSLAPLAAFFRNGMYLREVFTILVGRTGELLAVLAGTADVGILDWLVLRCGAVGRLLATGLRWVDEHVVDGLRWWACEIWWILKRLHSRYLQTGQIQFYMMIILLGAVLMCVVILRPLGAILSQILGSR